MSNTKRTCRQFILVSRRVSVEMDLTVITKNILCHAKKLRRPTGNRLFP